MSAKRSNDTPEDARETAIGIGSGIIAVGFWGLAIDVALKYSVFQSTLVIVTDDALWFFAAVFTAGLLLVAYAAASGSNLRRRTPIGRQEPAPNNEETRATPAASSLDNCTSFIPTLKTPL